jgi:hypothetical protein
MLFELIAAVVAAIMVAGIAMTLRWLSRGLLPKWIIPAAAGLGMLSYAIWSEYSWFMRSTATLPAGVEIAWKNEVRSPWRPWTYYKPVVTRFTAVSTGSVQRHPDHPGLVMADIFLSARWQQGAQVKVVFDCANNKRADLIGESVAIADDGSITGAQWVDVDAQDPTLRIVCRTGQRS